MSPGRCRSSLLVAASLLLLAAAPALAQERVGVAGAVNPNAVGTPPGQPTRTLLLGTDVVYNERIITEAIGQTELLFVDRSSFSIGPNSDLTIDEFVYNPSAGTGKLAVSAAKGVFRFVGGALSKNPDGVTIKTPTATIGLRGGIVFFSLSNTGRLVATLVYGAYMQVTANNVTVRTNVQNKTIAVEPGAPPSPPTNADRAQIRAVIAATSGEPGASGGSSSPPTGEQVDNSGYAQTNSQNAGAAQGDAQQNGSRGSGSPPPVNVANASNMNDVQTVQAVQGTGLNSIDLATFDINVNAPTSTLQEVRAQSGTASFLGVASGSVNNVSAQSPFIQSWDFAARSGQVSIPNFGGLSLKANVVEQLFGFSGPTVVGFQGQLTGLPAGSSGSISGDFQNLNGVPVSQTKGGFGFSGTGLSGSGQFRALRQ